jgi:hypothetical protein
MTEPPSQGTLVWVYYFNAQNRFGSVTVSIAPRHFQRVIPNYLGKLGVRWALVIPGYSGSGHSYGVAHKPESVYASKEEALLALAQAVKKKITDLEDALHQTMKGGGMA